MTRPATKDTTERKRSAMLNMKRREFLTLVSGAAAAWPLAARAQQAAQVRKIGLLAGGDTVVFTGTFREQLQKLGWTDGYNLRIDRRTSAAELLALDPDILLAESTPLVQELRDTPVQFPSCSSGWATLSSPALLQASPIPALMPPDS
jgi:hypothetical protein